jgi:DNA polymerase I-like protein with 3'-5' exonuclease and polymerase domains
MTLAWGPPEKVTAVFIPKKFLHAFKPWLESDYPQKVTTNGFGFDRHALANEGIELSGILADTALMSRLMDSRPDIDEHGGHSLEAWGARIGHNKAGSFKELVTVEKLATVPGRVKQYKKVGVRQGVLYGGEAQEVAFRTVVQQLGLDEVWEKYPERRERIQTYACTDPVVSLKVYEAIKKGMGAKRW